MKITPLKLAERFNGLSETAGGVNNPQIMAMLRLDNEWPQDDETPWCSAFVSYIFWLLRLARSRSLMARSWLAVGEAVTLEHARPGFDIVILQRGGGEQPGPEVLQAPGHVGFFAGAESGLVQILGGNQGDRVTLSRYPVDRILGIRRIL